MRKLPDYYIPPAPNFVPSSGSLSRPTASQLDRLARKQVDAQWSMTAFNKSFRLCYGIQVVPGWYMTRPVVNGAGNLVVAVYWCIGPIESVDTLQINSRTIPAGVISTTYLGNQVGVVDPTLAAALTGFADTYDGVAYTVFQIPPATVQGFPSQAQFMAQVHGRVISDNPAPSFQYWRIRPLEVAHASGRPSVSELQFRAVPGGPNVATGGTAISNTGIAGNAFDGNPGTDWQASSLNPVPDAWVGYNAGAGNAIAVNEVYMRASNTNPENAPTTFVLEYSSDNVSWFPFVTRSAQYSWTAGAAQVFTNNGLTSENPGEHLLDFVEDGFYGLGSPIEGEAEVIAFCDDLVGDPPAPRCRAGFTFWDSREREIIDMISAHAEALWSYDGFGVYVVPDAPVLVPAATLTLDQMQRGTFRITGKGLDDSPSVISLTYTDRNTGSLQWAQDSETVEQFSGYEVRSVVSMPGVYRTPEARRKATQRLRRLSASASFAWQHVDDGIAFQRGDVVRLPAMRGLLEQDVRILSINNVSAGIYQISGEPYSDSYYEGALPVPAVDVPVGAIVPYFSDDSLPPGWAAYDDANGLPLRSDTANAGTNTGVTDIPSVTGAVTSFVKNHTGPIFMGPGRVDKNQPGTNSRTKVPEGEHAHVYETGAAVPHEMLQVRRRLMEKTGAAGQLPSGAAVFADGPLSAPNMSAINTFIGRVIAAGASSEEAGDSGTRSIAVTFISDSGAHLEHEGISSGAYSDTPMFGPEVFDSLNGPAHDHGGAGSISVTVNPRRKRVAVYVASAETGISVGSVVGFDKLLPLPTGWAEFDLEGYLLEISTPSSAGTDAGNDTVTWTGETTPDGAHSHKGASLGSSRGGNERYHDTNTNHTHQMSGAAAFAPLAHCMRFIQYTGV